MQGLRAILSDAATKAIASDGAHVVYNERDGRLTANVSHGQNVSWIAHDEDGHAVPVIMISNPLNAPVSAQKQFGAGYKRCD